MSQAEELLNSLTSGDGPALYLAGNVTDEPHIVINADRTIYVPDELKKIAVQFDHAIETVTFDCPRYWDGHDLAKMDIYINCMRPDGQKDRYTVNDTEVDDTDSSIIHFTWTIQQFITMIKGQLSFLVCAKTVDSDGVDILHWNSELCQDLYISEGMECEAAIAGQNPSIIQELLIRMDDVESGLLPRVTKEDNGKILQVSDGAWTLVKILSAEEVGV